MTILFVLRQLNLAITSHFPYKISSWYKIKYHSEHKTHLKTKTEQTEKGPQAGKWFHYLYSQRKFKYIVKCVLRNVLKFKQLRVFKTEVIYPMLP